MKSTGEVMGIDSDFPKAFYKALESAYNKLPVKGNVLLSIGRGLNKEMFLPIAKELSDLGFKIYSTEGTQRFFEEHDVTAFKVKKLRDSPKIFEMMKNKELDHQLRVYSDITQLIASPQNPTPLVRLNRINLNKEFQIYLKLERYNPFGSVKDRIASEMLRALDIGGRTVVEPSSGNTGIALACVANALGIPIEIAVPERIPEEKKIMLRFLGARVTEADDALCPLFPTEGARGIVNALIKSPATKDSYVSPNQYENELNVQAHYQTTGPEIWRQTEGKIDYFFAGFGTCGTITGVGRYLKEQNPNIKIIEIIMTKKLKIW